MDILFPKSVGVAPVRLGDGQLFGAQPSWTAQIVALLKHCVAGKFVGTAALPSAIGFMEPGDALAAQKLVVQRPLLMGCCTNEGLGMLSDGQQTTALDSGLAISASSKGKEALQWQMKAEPLSSKGLITLEYVF